MIIKIVVIGVLMCVVTLVLLICLSSLMDLFDGRP